MISNNDYKIFHVHRGNWFIKGNAYKFYIERDDGVRLLKPISIGKSCVEAVSTNGDITTFKIKRWVIDNSLSRGSRIIEF